MASKSCSKNGYGGRPWQRSLDSQDFGFSSNLMDLGDVAPADELFFKGQLLPLLQDPKTHFVQSLCCSSSREEDDGRKLSSAIATARSEPCAFAAAAASCNGDALELAACRLANVSFNGDALELASCRLEQDASPQRRAEEETMRSGAGADGALLRQKQSARKCAESGYGALSWDEGRELSSHSQDPAMASCEAGGGADGIAMSELRSSSFRSQSSAFWDSGTEKDAMDSSSSRDSNGSSQDSYIHSHHARSRKSVQASHPDHFHVWPMLGFGIPTCLLKRGQLRKQMAAQDFPARDCSAPPSPDAEAALLPWKQQSDSSKQKLEENQIKSRARMPFSAATEAKTRSKIKDPRTPFSAASEAKTMHTGRSKIKDPNSKKPSVSQEKASEAAETKNHRSAAASKKWQMCARKLKPLCEMKVWMGQFAMMDDCGKRAYYEVEHGIVSLRSSANPAADVQQIMQRRLPHQRNSANFTLKSHRSSLPQQKPFNSQPCRSPAMSSCPSSTISSPNHSGVLDFLDPIQKITNSLKPANSIKKTHSKIPLKTHPNVGNAMKGSTQCSGHGCSSNYRSMSSVQELHSALQSAIAHCKESNKKLTMDDTAASN